MDVDAKDKIGKSPLHLACQSGDYDTVRALVEAGAFINAKGLDGEAPLFIAAKRADSVALISYLVRHGADINCVDRHGTAAASPCILSGCVASLAYVLDHVANINTRDNDGDSLVVDAIVWNKPAFVRLLIQRGVDYRGANKYGGTPFHMLATYGQVEVIQALAQMHLADVDITAKDNAGLTPLQVMEKRQNCAPDIREAFYKLLDSMERSYCGDQLTASPSVDVQDCGLSDDEMFFDCAEGP
ncbi:ankyrin [Thozetella sp. PMI_491]|nr:ankyrin [Thozetella sp. PMI_491]